MAGAVWAIVVAGGVGQRAGRDGGKQLANVLGRPVVAWTLDALDQSRVNGIVVVCPHEDRGRYRSSELDVDTLVTPVAFADSGRSRRESVASGLATLPESCEIAVVHDGARPLVTPTTIDAAVTLLNEHEDVAGVIVGHPSVDSLKQIDNGRVASSVDRSAVWAVQTPQVFRVEALKRAHGATESRATDTDDAALVERAGGSVLVLEGPRDNIKVTLPEDFAYVESVLRLRSGREHPCA